MVEANKSDVPVSSEDDSEVPELVEVAPKKLVRLDEAEYEDQQKLSECVTDLAYRVEVWPDLQSLEMKGRSKLSWTTKQQHRIMLIHMK